MEGILKMSEIPRDEDEIIANAIRMDEYRSRNLDKVNERVNQYLNKNYPLHEFYIMNQGDVAFRAYIFFEKENDLQKYVDSETLHSTTDEVFLFFRHDEGTEVSQISETLQEIIDFVYAELERVGRGKKGDIKVAFEFDSGENINSNPRFKHSDRLR